MARKLFELGTSAITVGNSVGFTLSSADFANNSKPTIAVGNLAGAESLSLWMRAGDFLVGVTDETGNQIEFTASNPTRTFNGVGNFALTKSATAGTVEVWLHTGR